MRSVPIDTAFGFIFVGLAPPRGVVPASVAKVWGQLGDELRAYGTENMVPLSPITSEVSVADAPHRFA